MAEGDRTGGSSGFDDWLEEDAGPDTDPYASLADDDAEAEIAEWMAFTQGEDEADDGGEATGGAALSDEPTPEDEVVADVEPTPDVEVLPDVELTPDAETTPDLELAPESGTVAADIEGEDDITAEIPMRDDTLEPLAQGQPATSVDVAEFVGTGRADTDEVPIVAAADVVSASVVNDTDETRPQQELDDPDALTRIPAVVVPQGDASEDGTPVDESEPADTDESSADEGEAADAGVTGGGEADTGDVDADGAAPAPELVDPDALTEMPAVVIPEPSPQDEQPEVATFGVVPEVSDAVEDTGELEAVPGPAHEDTGELEVVDEEADGSLPPSDDGPELFDITREDYVQTATREHATLAAAIAEAETKETEQVALAAPIPGLESTVVGFDDVVEAEGHRKARARASGNLMARVITAVVLIAALGASLVWRPALLILATVVFVIGAGEFYTALTRTGRHPIAIFGFVGIIGATVGAYVSGAIAILAAYVLVLTLLLLYYAVVPGRRDPAANLALTITVMVWVGLGSYAMLIAVSDNWRPLVIGTVVLVATMDIAQYFVGRAFGRHPLSPWVSPKKTVEGLVGGVIVALGLGALLHFVEPFELTSGLTLGAAVAVLAPLGDLAMSAAKRSLALKDMGSILPGHGGFLDRIDGLLFVIPAAWVIFLWTGLL